MPSMLIVCTGQTAGARNLPAFDEGVAGEQALRLRQLLGVIGKTHLHGKSHLALRRHLPHHVVAIVAATSRSSR